MEKRNKILFGVAGVMALVAALFWAKRLFFTPKPPPPKMTMATLATATKPTAAAKPGAATTASAKPGAPVVAVPTIKIIENGKEVEYKSPEDFMSKTRLPVPELLGIGRKKLDDAKKTLDAAQAKNDRNAVDAAKAEFASAQKLLGLIEAKDSSKANVGNRPIVYASLNKRDPFMNPLEIPKVYPPIPPNAKPLERVPVEKMTVKAIIWNQKDLRALVATEDGRGYTVKEGDKIGDKLGRVTKINKDNLIVTENIKDILGNVENIKTRMELYKKGGTTLR